MSVSQAVAKIDEGQQIIEDYREHFAMVLPSHIPPKAFVRLAQGLLRRNPDLGDAARRNPGSFLAALLECARLGHEPGTDQYALTWFNNNKTGVPEIVGIEQYQGEIERMYRAGAVQSVKCEVVRANDEFEWSPTTMRVPIHNYPPLAGDDVRGPLAGAYAFAVLPGGAVSQVVVMGNDEIGKHEAVAKSQKFWKGPWRPSMYKKTVIHELEKWVPTSAEYRREIVRSAAAADVSAPSLPLSVVPQPIQQPESDEPGDVHDAELVDDPQAVADELAFSEQP